MAAEIGNEYYKLRSKDGRDKNFKTPEDLLNACNDYFDWCLANPLKEQVIQKRKISRDEEIVEHYEINRMRAFTLQGLCNFLDISLKGFKLYETRKEYIPVTTRVRQIIYNQKFEGAAAGFLNSNIIARDLGLSDKQDHSSSDGSMKPSITLNYEGKKVDLSE